MENPPSQSKPESPEKQAREGLAAVPGSTFTACADCKKGDKTLCSQIGCIAKELAETV
jgi:hypothetical protein